MFTTVCLPTKRISIRQKTENKSPRRVQFGQISSSKGRKPTTSKLTMVFPRSTKNTWLIRCMYLGHPVCFWTAIKATFSSVHDKYLFLQLWCKMQRYSKHNETQLIKIYRERQYALIYTISLWEHAVTITIGILPKKYIITKITIKISSVNFFGKIG